MRLVDQAADLLTSLRSLRDDLPVDWQAPLQDCIEQAERLLEDVIAAEASEHIKAATDNR